MRNYVSSINNFGVILPCDVLGGDIFVIGDLPLVSSVTAKEGERVSAISNGIIKFKIDGTFKQGEKLFFHKTTKNIDVKNDKEAFPIGYALENGENCFSEVLFLTLAKIDLIQG